MTSPFPAGSRLVFYARDSGGDRQDTSIDQQQLAGGAWCREHDLILSRIFADAARSGTSLAGRAQFMAMLDYLSGDVPEKGVLIWEYARLARDYDDSQFYLADLRRRGIIIHSLTDAVPDSLEGRLLEAVISWKNASYSRDLSRNVRRGLLYSAETYHAHYGPAPAGYKRVSVEVGTRRDGTPHEISRLEPDEATAARVRRAFEMRASGATSQEIHAAVGLFRWDAQYYKMFRNPIYTGQRRFSGQIIDGYCPPIIDGETWTAVQTVNAQRATGKGVDHPRAVRSQYILSGLLRCGICGYLMTGELSRHPPYEARMYYRCQLHKNAMERCPASQIPKEIIEQRVVQVIQDRILIPEVLQDAYTQAREMATAGDASRQTDMARHASDLQSADRAIARLLAAIKAAGHSTAILNELASLEDARRTTAGRLAALEAARPRQLPEMDMTRIAAVIREKLHSASPSEVAQVLRGFIVSVRAVRPARGELSGNITYRLPVEGVEGEFYVSL